MLLLCKSLFIVTNETNVFNDQSLGKHFHCVILIRVIYVWFVKYVFFCSSGHRRTIMLSDCKRYFLSMETYTNLPSLNDNGFMHTKHGT